MDLEQRFGDTYRVTREKAAEGRDDPWGHEIRGRRGTVYPFGGELLAVELDRSPKVAKRLTAMGYRLHQDGDREKTFLVPADDLHALAKLLRLPVRRRLGPEQRAACVRRLRAYQKSAT